MDLVELEIEKIVPGGLGLARHEGKVAFVPCTAPGDRIRGLVRGNHRHHMKVRCLEILSPGPETIDPGCEVFGQCGGCSFRRLSTPLHHRVKEDFVREGLSRIGHLAVDGVIRPLIPAMERDGYRRRVGFKVQWTQSRLLMGFFAGASNTIVDLTHCPILEPRLAALMTPLRQLMTSWSVQDGITAVDAVAGDSGLGVIFYLLRSLSKADKARITCFAREQGVQQICLQYAPGKTIHPLVMNDPLSYRVAGFEIFFHPGDFIQVHGPQNQRMIAEVLLLGGEGEQAWDLFCGVGNFTLPLSGQFKKVIGIELHVKTTDMAKQNLLKNQVTNVSFQCEDLFRQEKIVAWLAKMSQADLVVLDPPRQGADLLCRHLAQGPKRVVYVSCDPATLARDAAILVQGGYDLVLVQPLDIFPQTPHVEIVALFQKT